MISKEDLFRIVEEATEGEPGSVDMTSTSETVENWDSLGHLLYPTSLFVGRRTAQMAPVLSAFYFIL